MNKPSDRVSAFFMLIFDKMNYHYLAHIISAVVIFWLVSILNQKPNEQTVSKAIYEAIKQDSARLANERDSIALLLGKSHSAIDSISNLPRQKELIYINRKDEITLIRANDLLDSVRSAIAE